MNWNRFSAKSTIIPCKLIFWRSFFLYVLSEKSSRYLPAYEKSKADLFSALPKLKPVMQKGHINLIKTLVMTEKPIQYWNRKRGNNIRLYCVR